MTSAPPRKSAAPASPIRRLGCSSSTPTTDELDSAASGVCRVLDGVNSISRPVAPVPRSGRLDEVGGTPAETAVTLGDFAMPLSCCSMIFFMSARLSANTADRYSRIVSAPTLSRASSR